jgi:alkanesulfonate monooxygenase SsuD/methylene tetrahydromethanopterin reductase-like flavin-dependent oxidoreductase (luciferase family)
VRFSVCLDPGRPWVEILDLTRQLDAVGWDGLYLCDHFMPYDPDGLPVDGAMLEGWTALAALAMTHPDSATVVGTPPQVLDILGRYRAAGADEFIVRDDQTTPLSAASDTLSLFWAEIVNSLR